MILRGWGLGGGALARFMRHHWPGCRISAVEKRALVVALAREYFALPDERFAAMMRLDHNRALTQVAQKLGTSVNDVSRMTLRGNHSATQYPDYPHD